MEIPSLPPFETYLKEPVCPQDEGSGPVSKESGNLTLFNSLAEKNMLGLPERPLEAGSAREEGNPASRLLGPWSVTHN